MNVILIGIGPYRIRPGDQVVYETPQGQEGSGRVVFSFDSHVTLNTGGKHGTPKVVDDRNFVGVRMPNKARSPATLTGPRQRPGSKVYLSQRTREKA